MRSTPNIRLERLRLGGPLNTNYGAFAVDGLRLIISTGGGWDHVSVSRADRIPTWAEMDRAKRLCFRDDEVVMQLHVSDDRKVNLHEHCLHLWRPQTQAEMEMERARFAADGEPWIWGDRAPEPIPRPPVEFV